MVALFKWRKFPLDLQKRWAWEPCKKDLEQGELEQRIIPAFPLQKLRLCGGQLLRVETVGLGTGGPGTVGRS